jgi:hypothetical protein
MSPQTETDRLKAVVRAASHAINNALCILLSEESNQIEYTAAVERIQAQAGGLLRVASQHSVSTGQQRSPVTLTETE